MTLLAGVNRRRRRRALAAEQVLDARGPAPALWIVRERAQHARARRKCQGPDEQQDADGGHWQFLCSLTTAIGVPSARRAAEDGQLTHDSSCLKGSFRVWCIQWLGCSSRGCVVWCHCCSHRRRWRRRRARSASSAPRCVPVARAARVGAPAALSRGGRGNRRQPIESDRGRILRSRGAIGRLRCRAASRDPDSGRPLRRPSERGRHLRRHPLEPAPAPRRAAAAARRETGTSRSSRDTRRDDIPAADCRARLSVGEAASPNPDLTSGPAVDLAGPTTMDSTAPAPEPAPLAMGPLSSIPPEPDEPLDSRSSGARRDVPKALGGVLVKMGEMARALS